MSSANQTAAFALFLIDQPGVLMSALKMIASAALGLSPVPFQGPIAAVRIGRINDELVLMPTQAQIEESTLDLVVAGNKTSVLMIEGFAREMPEDRMLEALAEAHRYVREICDLQLELAAKANVEKKQYETYFEDRDVAYGIAIERVWSSRPIDLESLRRRFDGFVPPQSYMYWPDRWTLPTDLTPRPHPKGRRSSRKSGRRVAA